MAGSNRKRIAIKNIRLFDGTEVTGPQTVLVDGDVIGDEGDVGTADETVDGDGGILVPGFIDAHVHLHNEGHLKQLAQHGVTTALDMATWPADKMNRLRNKHGVCDMRSAGLPVTARGSIHSHILPLPDEAFLTGPQQAEAFVEKRIQEGSDYIKIIADVPGPSQETLNAVSLAAHEKGKKVVAHAAAYVPFGMALDAKADVLTHMPTDQCISSDMVERMVANKVIAVPTLTMMEGTSQRPPISALFALLLKPSMLMGIIQAKRAGSRKPPKYANARDSVTACYKAGVPILAGTDCHEEQNSFIDVKHGESLHRELELLVEAGMSTVDTLRAATILPAQHFGLEDRGIIAPGKRADLVLLREDPLKDIRATRSVSRVWCAGIEVGL